MEFLFEDNNNCNYNKDDFFNTDKYSKFNFEKQEKSVYDNLISDFNDKWNGIKKNKKPKSKNNNNNIIILKDNKSMTNYSVSIHDKKMIFKIRLLNK